MQYLSIRYTERLQEAGIEPFVGSVGDSHDNAMAETVIGLYKTEDAVEYATVEWGVRVLLTGYTRARFGLGARIRS